MISQDQIFNEYYFDLLKKIKNIARATKHDSHNARVILRAIKKNYASYDKISPEFRAYVNAEQRDDIWSTYDEIGSDIDSLIGWVDSHGDIMLFKDISLETVQSEIADDLVFHHYLSLISLFRRDIPEGDLEKVIGHLKSSDVELDVGDESLATRANKVKQLQTKYTEKAVKDQINSLPDIENTSLGKLAKEIMDEMNIEELQTSLGNGDIMQALANPDGGLVKLLGTVSQKMISKMSSGEIKQENLLQDAMKLAGQIGGKDMGMLSNMASMFGGGTGAGGFNINDISKMMSGMMSPPTNPSKQTKVRPNAANMKKAMKKHELRAKLEQRKENVQGHVGDSSNE